MPILQTLLDKVVDEDGRSKIGMGEVFSTAAVFMFTLVAGTNVFIVLPMLKWTERNSAILLVGGLFVFVNMVVAYFCAATMDPGTVDESLCVPGEETGGKVPRARCKHGAICSSSEEDHRKKVCHPGDPDWEAAATSSTFCDKCSMMRPARAHHCKSCKRCILKMDHHCPWLNNCVGHNNQRYFCIFLFYLAIGSTITVLISLDFVIDATFYPRHCAITPGWRRWCVTSAWLFCALSLMGDTLIGCSQLYLVMTNQTTIEQKDAATRNERARLRRDLAFLRRRAETNIADEQNPFDVGCMENTREVCGSGPLCVLAWLFPAARTYELKDGHTYPVTSKKTGSVLISARGCTYDELILMCTVILGCAFWLIMLFTWLKHFWKHALLHMASTHAEQLQQLTVAMH